MMKKRIDFNLSEIAEGGLQEKFEHALKQVLQNIDNPNTDAKKKRKIVIGIALSPSENRDTINIDTAVKTTLAPENGVSTTMLLGKGTNGLEAAELKSGAKRQTFIGDDGNLKTDTGEPIEEAENKDVIDLQRKKAGK